MQVNLFEKVEISIKERDLKTFSTAISTHVNFGIAYLVHTFEIDPDQAYDCVMNVIEKLIGSFDMLCDKDHFNIAGYYLQSLKNEYRLFYRKEKKVFSHADFENIRAKQEAIYDQLFSNEEKLSLRRCIEKLPADQKEFIYWNISNPKPQAKEVEQKFDLTINAFYQRKHKIINKLRRCLGVF